MLRKRSRKVSGAQEDSRLPNALPKSPLHHKISDHNDTYNREELPQAYPSLLLAPH